LKSACNIEQSVKAFIKKVDYLQNILLFSLNIPDISACHATRRNQLFKNKTQQSVPCLNDMPIKSTILFTN